MKVKKLNKANIIELNHIIDCVLQRERIDPDLLKYFIEIRFALKQPRDGSERYEELANAIRGLRMLYESLSEVIMDNKREIIQGTLFSEISMTQPKYKVSDAALLLKVERATLNNWTNQKGGQIRSFEFEGTAKFILEEDLKNKYLQLTGQELVIDEETRNKYQYKIDKVKLNPKVV